MIKNILKNSSVFDLPQSVVRKVFFANSLFVAFFLILFKPFQLYRSTTLDLLSVSLMSGFYIFLFGFGVFYALRKVIQRQEVKKHNYFWFELLMSLSTLVLVSSAVFLTRVVAGKVPFTLEIFFLFLYYSLILSPFLVVMMRIVLIVRELVHLSKAKAITVSSNHQDLTGDEVIFVPVNSSEETISFPLAHFVYAFAEGNYIHLYQKKEGELHRTIIRCTLNKFVKRFEHIGYCLQCHRSYFVNTQMVKRMIKENNTTKLVLVDLSTTIPVSRSNLKAVKEHLNSN
ncbi:hypothetical protein EYS14_05040 [Alteromonadaceae bacterium M269]|nr:hypothetical protein EYS14_05040 [Alteromonadaceae bacterium M269]